MCNGSPGFSRAPAKANLENEASVEQVPAKMADDAKLKEEIKIQGEKVRQLKAEKASKDTVTENHCLAMRWWYYIPNHVFESLYIRSHTCCPAAVMCHTWV